MFYQIHYNDSFHQTQTFSLNYYKTNEILKNIKLRTLPLQDLKRFRIINKEVPTFAQKIVKRRKMNDYSGG